MITAIYSILHFFVDGVCAFAMGTYFAEAGYEKFLIYNFCAFALQMPMGAFLDGLTVKSKKNWSMGTAILGVIFTLAGACLHPAVLGVGNALFHVGAGVSVIREDYGKSWRGQALGVFVAPGALGLFVGTQLAGGNLGNLPLFIACAGMLLFVAAGWKAEPKKIAVVDISSKGNRNLTLMVACFLVVILRSYVGLAVTFSWKNSMAAGLVSVLAVVFGKMAGGIGAVRFGTRKTVILSLVLAAVCFIFSEYMMFGVLALFLFNMTMPITLYLLVDQWRELPGFSFGLLTFGLFLGFLPVYLGISFPMEGGLLGCVGSMVSLVLLLWGLKESEA